MDTRIEANLERKLKQLDGEYQWVFAEKNTLDIVSTAVKEVAKTEYLNLDFADVCQKIAVVLNVTSNITPSIQVFQIKVPLSVVATVFQELGKALKSNDKRTEHENRYSELQDSEIRMEAIAFEKGLININANLQVLRNAPDVVTHFLEFDISLTEIITFLSKIQDNAKKLVLSSDKTSACRAAAYINLYFRLAILRTLVLWQVLCIKKRNGSSQSNTQKELTMIIESQETDIEMLKFVTEACFSKAVFLTMFHPKEKENENFIFFLRIQEYRIPCIGQERGFSGRNHAIRSSNSPDVKLEFSTSSWYGGHIIGTKESSAACSFKFQPLRDRKLDNIFYLKTRSDHYVYMMGNGSCYSKERRPGLEGQWKLIRFENSRGPPQFVLSTLKWPCQFLYMYSFLGNTYISGTSDLEKVKSSGLWDILDI